MSRSFNGTTQYLSRNDILGIVGYPFTMGLDFKLLSDPTNTAYMMIFSKSAGVQGFAGIGIFGAIAGNPVMAFSGDSVAGTSASVTGGNTTVGTWHRVVAEFLNASSRSIWLDSNAVVTNTTAINFDAGMDRLCVGAYLYSGGPVLYTNCEIANAFVIGTQIGTRDIEGALRSKIDPKMIRPQLINKIDFWDMAKGGSTDEYGLRGNVLTATNAPAVVSGGPARYGI